MEGYEGLIIRQDSLIWSKWVHPVFQDEKLVQEGFYAEEDVTERSPQFLMTTCQIEDGTTLRDIFKLLNRHREFFAIIQQRNWFSEWLDAGLRSPIMDLSKVSQPDELEFDYLEIYAFLNHQRKYTMKNDRFVEMESSKDPDVMTRHKIFSKGEEIEEETCLSIDFHGISKPLTKKYLETQYNGYGVEGAQIAIGLLGSNITEYIDLPVKLRNSLPILESWYEDDIPREEKKIYNGFASYRFIDIVEAIFYEISFHGSPEDREKWISEMREIQRDMQREIDE